MFIFIALPLAAQALPAEMLSLQIDQSIPAFVSGLWTGHLAHWTVPHFVWDWVVFATFGALLGQSHGLRRLSLWLFAAAPIISLGLLALSPGLTEYRGLSALATLLFTAYTAQTLRQLWPNHRRHALLLGALPLCALIAKTSYEFLSGDLLFAGDLGPGVSPLPEAHLLGILFGLLWTRPSRNPHQRLAASGRCETHRLSR